METTDYEHGRVPEDQRKGWLPLTAVWIAIGIDLSGAFLGIELANGMDFWPALAATLIGSTILGLLAMATSYIGSVTGLTTALISRITFGRIGGVVLSLVLAVCLLGWFSVQAGFFGLHAQVAVSELVHVELPVWLTTGIGGVLMLLTALWGYRSISKLSEWAVPLMLVLLLLGVVLALVANGVSGLDAPSDGSLPFGTVVSLVISIFVMGVCITPDFARWAKTPKQAMGAGFVGFFIGNSLIVIVAMILSRVVGADDLITIFFILGIGIVAVVVLILAQWTTNTTNIYSSALSFSSISGRLNRRVVTVVLGVIGIGVAMLGAADYFISFLSAIGILVAPFGGVYIATFVFGRSRFVFGDARRTAEPLALVAWVFGILTALSTASPADGIGFGLFLLTTVSSLDGLLAGFVLYAVVALLTGKRPQRAGAASEDAAIGTAPDGSDGSDAKAVAR